MPCAVGDDGALALRDVRGSVVVDVAVREPPPGDDAFPVVSVVRGRRATKKTCSVRGAPLSVDGARLAVGDALVLGATTLTLERVAAAVPAPATPAAPAPVAATPAVTARAPVASGAFADALRRGAARDVDAALAAERGRLAAALAAARRADDAPAAPPPPPPPVDDGKVRVWELVEPKFDRAGLGHRPAPRGPAAGMTPLQRREAAAGLARHRYDAGPAAAAAPAGPGRPGFVRAADSEPEPPVPYELRDVAERPARSPKRRKAVSWAPT